MTQRTPNPNTSDPLDPTAANRTTDDGQTPIDESMRKTGQESGTETRPGAESESAGGTPMKEGAPNQGTESR